MNLLRKTSSSRRGRSAFTLIEIMVVVAIMGMILATGVPTLYKFLQKEGFRKSLGDVKDVFRVAREQAIMKNEKVEVIWRPVEGTFSGGGKSGRIEQASIEGLFVNLRNFTSEEEARVRFYPNGSSDEFLLILRQEGRGEQMGVAVELATGIASVLSADDLQKLRDGAL